MLKKTARSIEKRRTMEHARPLLSTCGHTVSNKHPEGNPYSVLVTEYPPGKILLLPPGIPLMNMD